MEIKVLGPGCPKCQQTEQIVKEAVADSGLAATVEKITERLKQLERNIIGLFVSEFDTALESVAAERGYEMLPGYAEGYSRSAEFAAALVKRILSEVTIDAAKIWSGEEARDKVGWLERELEKWVVATDFDYKS